jgi:hypothetical protein
VEAREENSLLGKQISSSVRGVVGHTSLCVFIFLFKIIPHIKNLLGRKKGIPWVCHNSPVTKASDKSAHVVFNPPLVFEVNGD